MNSIIYFIVITLKYLIYLNIRIHSLIQCDKARSSIEMSNSTFRCPISSTPVFQLKIMHRQLTYRSFGFLELTVIVKIRYGI
jgi:hypothetical protein